MKKLNFDDDVEPLKTVDMPNYRDKDWLYDQYWNKGKNQREMGDLEGVKHNTIAKWMKILNVPRRDYNECKLGNRHPRWKGGKIKKKTGYIAFLKPDHHRATSDGYVLEHILVAEEKYGKKILLENIVHHIDGDKVNNEPENLYLCEDMEHQFSLLGIYLIRKYHSYKTTHHDILEQYQEFYHFPYI